MKYEHLKNGQLYRLLKSNTFVNKKKKCNSRMKIVIETCRVELWLTCHSSNICAEGYSIRSIWRVPEVTGGSKAHPKRAGAKRARDLYFRRRFHFTGFRIILPLFHSYCSWFFLCRLTFAKHCAPCISVLRSSFPCIRIYTNKFTERSVYQIQTTHNVCIWQCIS